LTGRNLRPIRKDVNNGAAAGQVVDQNPKAYASVNKGDVITLSVSTGKIGVPNEVGKKVQDALSDLSAQGWTNVQQPQLVTVTDHAQDGVVLQQYPTPGSAFPKGQQITLTVGSYVAPTPTCTTPTTTPGSTTPSTTPGSTSGSPSGPPTTTPTTTPPIIPNILKPSTPPDPGDSTPAC